MKKIRENTPGFLLAFLLALISRKIESLFPSHLIGASVIALFLGMIINNFRRDNDIFSKGLDFSSKKILRIAIIFLGASLNVATILSIGKLSISVMFFTLLTCFGGGYFIGNFLGLNWKMSNLISAGTGICGGSAIASIAPVIDADDVDIAYALSATFIFDMLMIVLFPIMGKALNMSDIAFGLWAGTAVNDTSSVVAASYAFSEKAGDFATMVKLTRTLVIIPTVIVFSLISNKINNKNEKINLSKKIFQAFPLFILGFLALSLLNSIGLIPIHLSQRLKFLSKFFMVVALAAIGLKTNFSEMKKSGTNPLIHGFIISLLVVIVALVVEYFLGLV